MKHASQLALASVAAMFAVSAQAGSYDVFSIDFDSYTKDASPTAATEAAGTWALGAEDDGTIVTTNGTSASDFLLQLAASTNSPVTFTTNPTDESNVLVMDVFFVGSAEAQLPEANSQLGLYLDTSDEEEPVMKVSVNGGQFQSMTTAANQTLAENTWYNVTMKFTYGATPTVTVTVKEGATTVATFTGSTQSEATKVNSVAFCGTGLVDNFTGKYAFDSYTDTTEDGTGETDSNAPMTVATVNGNKTLTTSFVTENLKFITVTGEDSSGNTVKRTLRYTDGQSINLTGSGIAKITKVVAYYGNNVTATTGANTTTTPTLSNGTVSGTVAATSGLYYSVDIDGDRTPLNGNEPVAPEEDGDELDYSVSPSPAAAGYGVVKFKIVASDEPVAE